MNPTQLREYLDGLTRRSISPTVMHRTATAEPKTQPVFADYSEQLAYEREQAERLAAEKEAAKNAKPQRSKMSAKEKADFIGKHGGKAYLALPW